MIGLLLAVHAALLARIAYRTNPVCTEVGHMAAGLYSWQTCKFDVFQVNPPLVRTIATAPVAICSPKYDWAAYSPVPSSRCEWSLGTAFIGANGFESAQWYFLLSRWTCIPLSLLGGYISYRLASETFGRASGLCALTLWCCSPSLLAWGSTICPDVTAASLSIAAIYAFHLWLREPCWDRALVAGLVLGLAELTKFTLLIFYPLLPLLWLLYRMPEFRSMDRRLWGSQWCQLVAALVLSVFVINAGYGFENSCQLLGDYRFQSQKMSGADSSEDVPPEGMNRFSDNWLAMLPVPLPASMVHGIDTQLCDFEHGLPSYLRGQWADHGWWYYYLYALTIKEPLGTWCLIGLALGATIVDWRRKEPSLLKPLPQVAERDRYGASWRDEMIVLVPGVVILIFVSSQTGFSIHLRYIIPALPFVFVWASKIARAFEMRPLDRTRFALATIVALMLTWSAGSSLAIYPHSLSYFNELAVLLPTPANNSLCSQTARKDEEQSGFLSSLKGLANAGPLNGPRHLLNSNIDWGQDLLYLRDWLSAHPETRLDGLAVSGPYPATTVGIPETASPPLGLQQGLHEATAVDSHLGPKPGWYALSVSYIYGRDDRYRYFLNFEPVTMAGYSIYIYHITADAANRVRRELGLRDLDDDG